MASLSNAALARVIARIFDHRHPDILNPHIDPHSILQSDPQPNPWAPRITTPGIPHGALIARAVIEQATATLRTAVAIAGAEGEKRALGMIGSQMMEDIEQCGNGRWPWRWPWPWPGPWKFILDEVSLVDKFVAAAVFQSYADQFRDSPLADTFAKAADSLISAAAKQFEAPTAR